MARRDVIQVSVDDAQLDALNALSKETGVPRAALIRNALDLYFQLLARHRSFGRTGVQALERMRR